MKFILELTKEEYEEDKKEIIKEDGINLTEKEIEEIIKSHYKWEYFIDCKFELKIEGK